MPRRRLILVVGCALLGACSKPKVVVPPACDLPQVVNTIVQASDRVNLDENGHSLPTIVRVYQLKGPIGFENAEFDDIWRDAEKALGKDLLEADEFTIYPNQRLQKNLKRNPKACCVAAVAIVRRPAGVSWRTLYELPPPPEETRCAAQKKDPEGKEEPTPEPAFNLYLEDYRIEAMEEKPPEPKKNPCCQEERAEKTP